MCDGGGGAGGVGAHRGRGRGHPAPRGARAAGRGVIGELLTNYDTEGIELDLAAPGGTAFHFPVDQGPEYAPLLTEYLAGIAAIDELINLESDENAPKISRFAACLRMCLPHTEGVVMEKAATALAKVKELPGGNVLLEGDDEVVPLPAGRLLTLDMFRNIKWSEKTDRRHGGTGPERRSCSRMRCQRSASSRAGCWATTRT